MIKVSGCSCVFQISDHLRIQKILVFKMLVENCLWAVNCKEICRTQVGSDV
jgi:hypothetical protein